MSTITHNPLSSNGFSGSLDIVAGIDPSSETPPYQVQNDGEHSGIM